MDVEKACRDDLLLIATTYAKNAGNSLVTVSKNFHGRTRFFEELRDGTCTISLQKLTAVVDKFVRLWPRDLAWPKTKLLKKRRLLKTGDGIPQVSAP